MPMIDFLSSLLLLWLLFNVARRVWRLFVVLFFAALISGCASTSNSFDQSPCACDFQPLNLGNLVGQGHA